MYYQFYKILRISIYYSYYKNYKIIKNIIKTKQFMIKEWVLLTFFQIYIDSNDKNCTALKTANMFYKK